MQIDKDIPLPKETRWRKKQDTSIRATLQKMEVLTSFLYHWKRKTIWAFISRYWWNRTFATRIVEGGVRVWRIK